MKIAVGEVLAWFDPDFMLLVGETHPYLFLVLQRGGYSLVRSTRTSLTTLLKTAR